MAFRNIIIESPARISIKNEQLIVETDTKYSIPVEDISALLLESRQSTITTAALSFLGQSGCSVFVCDSAHMPCAVLEPFSQHSRQLQVIENQISCGKLLKNQLWKSIVQMKIMNQAACLEYTGNINDADILKAMANNVKSGDSGNVEANAAAKYFHFLLGNSFIRHTDSHTNSALNYGYAILRGCIARNLATYGFIPSVGIHHCSELNKFNLADDLIEPFRPVVDLLVFKMLDRDKFDTDDKRVLFNLLNLEIDSDGQKHSVAYAIERFIASYGKSLSNEKAELCLTKLLELKQHTYE